MSIIIVCVSLRFFYFSNYRSGFNAGPSGRVRRTAYYVPVDSSTPLTGWGQGAADSSTPMTTWGQGAAEPITPSSIRSPSTAGSSSSIPRAGVPLRRRFTWTDEVDEELHHLYNVTQWHVSLGALVMPFIFY